MRLTEAEYTERYKPRRCLGCSAEFVPGRIGDRHKGLYCSRACNGQEGIVHALCATCGGSFRKRSSENKYCSKNCASVSRNGKGNPSWNGGKVTVACELCGKQKKAFPSQAHRRFCSRACAGVSSIRRGDANPNWHGGLQDAKCRECGKEFQRRQGVKAVYCSRSCFTVGEFSSKTASRWITKWAGSSKKSGKRADLEGRYFRSSWEANYARYLNFLISLKEITSWLYEADTFEFHSIKRGTRFYTPDFKVTLNNGEVEYHEVKGWKHPKGETALRRMAKFYPEIVICLIDQPVYMGIQKRFKGMLHGWE